MPPPHMNNTLTAKFFIAKHLLLVSILAGVMLFSTTFLLKSAAFIGDTELTSEQTIIYGDDNASINLSNMAGVSISATK